MSSPDQRCVLIPTSHDPLVLLHHGWRIEIHLRHDENGITTLLAYAGRTATPERVTHQGPFQRAGQAVGARRAIVQPLLTNGYQLASSEPPIWSLRAQRDIRAIRDLKQRSCVSYEFNPRDVFLDW